jgi:hypothetical protein
MTSTARRTLHLLTAAVAAAVLLTAASASAVAGTATMQGQATLHFGGYPGHSGDSDSPGLSNAPCDPGAFCGIGSVTGLGRVMVYLDGDEFGDEISRNCFAYAKDEAIVPLDGSGVLVLHSTGTACFVSGGNSAPPQTDFGNPGTFATTFVADPEASEGRFAGATGSGSEVFTVAGDVAQWSFRGSLSTQG